MVCVLVNNKVCYKQRIEKVCFVIDLMLSMLFCRKFNGKYREL